MTRFGVTQLVMGVVVMIALAITPQARAQSIYQPTPPEFYTQDARGVDLVLAEFNYVAEEVVIGQPGAGGLVHSRGAFPSGWRDALQGSLSISGVTYTVTLGLESSIFVLTGGVFVPQSEDGSTLTNAGALYTYTTRTGAVAKYSTAYAATATGQPSTTMAMLYEQTKPNGEQTNYHYVSQTYCRAIGPDGCLQFGTVHRLQSITNNYGYQIAYTYQSDNVLLPSGASLNDRVGRWLRMTSATGVNNAVDYCAPTAFSCSYSRTWPSVTYGTDGSGNQTVTDQSGLVTTYKSAPWAVRLPGSTVDDVTYAITGVGPPTTFTVTDASGTWNYSYSDSGSTRTMTASGPLGQSTTVVSDMTIKRATTVTEVTSTSPAVSRTWSYLYDGDRRPYRVTNPEGDYHQVNYTSRGNISVSLWNPKPGASGAIATYASFPASCSNPITCNRPTTTTDERGNVTDYAWNATHGGLESITSPAPTGGADRPQTRIAYAGQTAYYKNSSGVIVAAPSSITLPISTSACASGTGPSCSHPDRESRSTITYGATGVANNLLPTSTTSSDGTGGLAATNTMTWTPNGDLETMVGPMGSADMTRYRYDAGRRPLGAVGPDPDGGGALLHRAERITYDARGLISLVEQGTTSGYTDGDWAGFSTLQRQAAAYDDWRRPVISAAQDASGNTLALTQVGYDAAGRAECSAIRMNPGAFPGLPGSTNACTQTALGSYGPDRISQVIYDQAGRPVSAISGVGSGSTITESVTYTANGQPRLLTDGNGNISQYSYDGFDRPEVLNYPLPGGGGASPTDYEQYGYDAASNIVWSRNRAGQTFTATYDALNRRTALNAPAGTPSIAYSYDLLNQMTVASNGSQTLTQEWDALGRLTKAWGGPAANPVIYAYDAASRRTRTTWPDGYFADYDWNLGDDLTGVRENGATSGPGVLAAYGYDNLGRRTVAIRGNGVWSSYGYDGISRLAWMNNDPYDTPQDVAWNYSYNPAGQIVTRSVSNSAYVYTSAAGATAYANNGLNQVTAINGAGTGHDANQNLTSALGLSFSFNALNQMTAANPGWGTATFNYDPLGRMNESTGGATLRYLYDGQQMIGEYDTSGNLVHRYVPGAGLDDVVTSYDALGNRTWLLADERGSVVSLADGSGTVTTINKYDEYGVPAPGNAGRFQYTGQPWLPDAQLYHYRARAYLPGAGRFVQPDPIGYQAGMNVYGYVGADPMNWTDPLGLQPADVKVPGSRYPGRAPGGSIGGGNKGTPSNYGEPPEKVSPFNRDNDANIYVSELEEIVVSRSSRRPSSPPRMGRYSPIQPILNYRYVYLSNQIRRYNPNFSVARAPGPTTPSEVRNLEYLLYNYRRVYFSRSHYARRLQRAGIDVASAESAARIAVAETGAARGTIYVNGQMLYYRSFQYQGRTHVGTIHIPY
jgi:RHS repeat-associated protein